MNPSHPPGWNDPPTKYDPLKNITATTAKLNKRVAFPLSSNKLESPSQAASSKLVLPPPVIGTPPSIKIPPTKSDEKSVEVDAISVADIIRFLNESIDKLADPSQKDSMLESIKQLNENWLNDNKHPELVKKLYNLTKALENEDSKMTAIYQSIAIEYGKENWSKVLKMIVFNAPKCDK